MTLLHRKYQKGTEGNCTKRARQQLPFDMGEIQGQYGNLVGHRRQLPLVPSVIFRPAPGSSICEMLQSLCFLKIAIPPHFHYLATLWLIRVYDKRFDTNMLFSKSLRLTGGYRSKNSYFSNFFFIQNSRSNFVKDIN